MLRTFVAAAAITAALALFSTPTTHGGSTPGQIDLVAIDTDPTGNQPNGPLGPVDSCREVAVGETFMVDVIVDEIDGSDGITGFSLEFVHPDDHVTVESWTAAGLMLDSMPGSNLLTGLSESLPDGDGRFLMVVLDFGAGAITNEVGKGVLARLNLRAGDAGYAFLEVQTIDVSSVDEYASTHELSVGTTQGGLIAIGASCAAASDPDGDGFCTPGLTDANCSGADNCPGEANADQGDRDNDGRGDACDPCPDSSTGTAIDHDLDGLPTCLDNCSNKANPAQEDSNDNGVGDICENEIGILSATAECPEEAVVDEQFECSIEVEFINYGPMTPVELGGSASAYSSFCLPVESENEYQFALLGVGETHHFVATVTFDCSQLGDQLISARFNLHMTDPALVDPDSTDNTWDDLFTIDVQGVGPSSTSVPSQNPTPTAQQPSTTLTPDPCACDLVTATPALSPAALPQAGQQALAAAGGSLAPLAAALGLGGAALIASALFARRRPYRIGK
jgi:hypothetical protein